MARIHQARQRIGDKRWDFTISSDEEGWAHATGYCAGYRELEPGTIPGFSAAACERDNAKIRPFKDKYHTDGHATAAEAEACHREYELDQETHYGEDSQAQQKCEACEEWTTGRATVGTFLRFVLCPTHQTRADIERLIAKRRIVTDR